MSFVCTLVDGEFHPDVHRQGNGYLVIIPIGFDDGDIDSTYSLFVTLGPQAGGMLELAFCIVVEDGDGIVLDEIWDSARARHLFDKASRRLILMNLLVSIRSLLELVKPQCVFITTMDLDPAENALRKYMLIARVFEMCGYSVGKYDRYERQCVFRMDRISALAVDTFDNDVSLRGVTGVDDNEPR